MGIVLSVKTPSQRQGLLSNHAIRLTPQQLGNESAQVNKYHLLLNILLELVAMT